MRVILISPYGGITNLGIRYLSSCLKKKNHNVKLVFLPQRLNDRGDFENFNLSYPAKVLFDLKEFCRKSDLVGISVMTPYFRKAVELTKFLKRSIKTPVAWGGIHPTVEPSECLEYADIVCLGEGEEAVLELTDKMAKGENFTDTWNFWFKIKDQIIRNPVRNLRQDLNNLPFPDYELENHYILDQNRIAKLAPELLEKYFPFFSGPKNEKLVSYPIFCTRGCPHGCSYCCNNVLRGLYAGQRYIRRRSVENIIEELKEIKNKFPFIKGVKIEDDSFLVAPEKEILDFAASYKKNINLPFICLSSPVNITEKKVSSLVNAGMAGIQMGIQSGSDSLNKNVFTRPIKVRQILSAAKIISKYQKQLNPRYDIITDNPFESEKDLIKTIKILSKIKGKYILNLYSLVFYPGTALSRRAIKQGIIKNKQEVYSKDWLRIDMDYLKFLIFLNRFSFFKIPQVWLKFLLAKPVVKIGRKFDFLFDFIYRTTYFVRLKLPSEGGLSAK